MPYWRLSAVYFCYFAVVGALSPYWGLYLEDLGYQPADIGLLSAIPMLTKLAAPNIWGALADYSGRRLRVIRLGAAGACICFLGILIRQDYVWLIAVTIAYSFFWNAILAQFEVVTLSYLDAEPHSYSRVRLWGSVGFIVTVVVLGYMLEVVSIRHLPLVIFIFLTGILLSAISLPSDQPVIHQRGVGRFLEIIKEGHVLWFFAVMALLQLSHGVYYTFYSIYLESFGYSRTFIGVLWAIGVIAEILIFLRMPQLFKWFSILRLLQVSLLLTAIRWWVIGWFPQSVLFITLIQILHAFSFGVAHAIAIEFVRTRFSESAQSQGQAFYSAVCFGGGNALGAYISGLLWQEQPLWAFAFAVFAVLMGFVFSLLFIPAQAFAKTICVGD
ncbi:MFS transporter [Teredinibacter haidensis]|uniref:MFS transporter n=1 Tax=Teredinibacter haidensis TaxID=2731755 RepID=UPI0009490A3D|nr:MFS transporter [Teredinibacter haidensis]